jgi:hypothetical protein
MGDMGELPMFLRKYYISSGFKFKNFSRVSTPYDIRVFLSILPALPAILAGYPFLGLVHECGKKTERRFGQ